MGSETSPPRISFSNDLARVVDDSQIEISRRDTNLLDSNSNPDFEFSFTSLEQESRSADELFANGMILPVQGKKAIAQQQHQQQIIKTKNPSLKIQNRKIEDNGENSRSYWKFKRSDSLKCDVNTKSIILPFPILSRSNSTGSLQNSKKLKSLGRSSLSSSSNNSATQKPPLMKNNNNGSSYGNYGMKISPVLNVPPPSYISRRTANLLGFGFLLRNGNDKKNKK